MAGKTTSLRVPLRSSSWSRSAGAATSAIEEMATTKSIEIANRIRQLETNNVSERAARLDAEQHGPSAEVSQKFGYPSSVIKADRHESMGRIILRSLWNDWELVMLSHRPAGK